MRYSTRNLTTARGGGIESDQRIRFLELLTGVAWLSQVRAVRCLVQSNNERNRRGEEGSLLPPCPRQWDRESIKSSPYDPYAVGCRCVTMVLNSPKRSHEGEQAVNAYRSSDRRLQLTFVREELVVITHSNGVVKLI